MNPRRSASVGALPHEKKHYVSRNESTSGVSLDVRCACQYFQCDSLLPERVNPVDSRPSSNLGHYTDLTAVNLYEQQAQDFDMPHQRGMQQPTHLSTAAMQLDELSTRSFNMTGPLHRDLDRMSAHSVDPTAAAVDLSFVEKYPELEQTAKTRGLVVQSISTASNIDTLGRQRRRSLSRMSTGSGYIGHGHVRDMDTVSVRSGTSLRRISRSPSKADLYVADINIPTSGAPATGIERREERRSMSASRHTSNVDLSHTLPPTASRQIVSAQLHVATIAPPPPPAIPQVNLIEPTPSPAVGMTGPDFERGRTLQRSSSPSRSRAPLRDVSPVRRDSPNLHTDFVRATTPQRTASPPAPPEDYRKAKPPTTTDYMRPEENKQNFRDYHQPGEVLPQNRPIDVSKYDSYGESVLIKPMEQRELYNRAATSQPAPSTTFASTLPRSILPQRSLGTQRATTLPHMPSNLSHTTASHLTAPIAATDPLQQMVAQLEAHAATTNIEDIRDNIRMETTRDPSLAGEIQMPVLQLDEETKIEIRSAVPIVDIDSLIKEEEFKARQNQQKPRSRPQSPQRDRQKLQKMDTLQLPERSRSGRTPTTETGSSTSLKRQHSPDRSTMPKQRGRSPTPQNGRSLSQQDVRSLSPQDGRSTAPSTQRGRSPSPSMQHGSPPSSIIQRGRSPSPSVQHVSPPSPSMQRGRSPSPSAQHGSPPSSIMQRGRSPSPSVQHVSPPSPSMQRGRSPSPSMQHGSPPSSIMQRASSPVPSPQRLQPQAIVIHGPAESGVIPLTEASPEAKSTYTSRFKSMFSSKNKDLDRKPSSKRQKSPSPKRRQSVSPAREKSPSPMPAKLMSVFSKSKPMAIVSGTSAVVTTKPDKEPMSVRITETFSLKVDDMDQYSIRPSRPAPPPASTSARTSPARTVLSSRENFVDFERISNDIPLTEAFTPVIIPTANRAQFLAGNRSFYSSEIDLQSQRSASVTRNASKEQLIGQTGRFQVPKGALISMPINIGGSGQLSQVGTPAIGNSEQNLQQRVAYASIVHKSPFDGGRTQSQDRSRSTAPFDDMFGKSITKTVSFHFEERKSRLTEFESGTVSQKQRDQRDFLEKSYFSRDHEYEPIGQPIEDVRASSITKEASPARPMDESEQAANSKLVREFSALHDDGMKRTLNQDAADERYLSSEATTPRTESRTDYEIHTSQVDSSALEELPLKPENRKKSFMASAQDRTRKMQAGFKNQAGKIKTKFRTPPTKKSSSPPPPQPSAPTAEQPTESPKPEKRKRFKAPEFAKMKMPDIKRPDISKFKEIKRPEFTKFSKPDMSKFKLPEKFSTLKIRRSKSFKENETPLEDDDVSAVTPESGVAVTKVESHPQSHKKIFDFKFGTYPRAFRRKQKPVEPESLANTTGTENPSTVPSTVTQPSLESSSSPQGDRGPGPVRSRWADKFSDVSYNDSEGSRYRRYGSEQESFDRESSLERQMKEEMEESASDAAEMGILGGASEFPEFDEENRAIHEISSQRAGEFKRRRPMVHQDSDLRSEDSKDAVGWTDKEIQKNKLLQKAEYEAELTFIKYNLEDPAMQDTRSTASSGKKVVMEEIDDDEFFLRKRGISEDNIQLRQLISEAIREGYDVPRNALDAVGRSSDEFGYDAPPPKPRRLHRNYQPENVSQEFETQRSDYGDDLSVSQNESDFFGAPKRPLRKGRSRSKYSAESQEPPQSFEDISRQRYFDDDEDYLRPPKGGYLDDEDDDVKMNNLDINVKETEQMDVDEIPQPQVPRRRKRQTRESSLEKEAFMNGFGGRSVSNSYLQPHEDVIVYRTEHEYPIPRATPEMNIDVSTPHVGKSRSTSRFEEDDRTSRGADSLALDTNLKQEYDADSQDKFIIDMMENDGYAIVRKEHLPKPTPPARRKKFTRSPGERFATLPNIRPRSSRNTPPPERPPPPRSYTPSTDLIAPQNRTAALSLEPPQNHHHQLRPHIDDDDYEELSALDYGRAESPRDLQSGEVVSRMKGRPLPAPPRPPREKRQRGESRESHDSHAEENLDDRDFIATSSTVESELESEPQVPEVEVSTQTDPLPDDFVCEEFEITSDMKVIEPRTISKTLEELLAAAERKIREQEAEEERQMTEDEQLARGLQRFREANQRSVSERSRASSQADRSRSLSRPQTPSAVVIERRVSTPVPSQHSETMVEASLIVRPIDDLDLEEEALRREGLLSDSSQHSKSDLVRSDNEESDWKLRTKKFVQEEVLSGSEENEWRLQESRSGESELEEGNVDDIDYDESELGKEDFEEPEVKEKSLRSIKEFSTYEGKVEDKTDEEVEGKAPLTMRDYGYDEEAGTEEEKKHTLTKRDYGYEEESRAEVEDKTKVVRDDSRDYGSEAEGAIAEEKHIPLTMRDYGYQEKEEEKEQAPLTMRDYGFRRESEDKTQAQLTTRGYSYEEEEPSPITMRDHGFRRESEDKTQVQLTTRGYSYEEEAVEEEPSPITMRDHGFRRESEDKTQAQLTTRGYSYEEEAVEEEPSPITMRDHGFRRESEDKSQAQLTTRGYSYEEEEPSPIIMRDHGFRRESEGKTQAQLTTRGYSYEEEEPSPITMRDHGFRRESEDKTQAQLTTRGYSYEEEEPSPITMRDHGYQAEVKKGNSYEEQEEDIDLEAHKSDLNDYLKKDHIEEVTHTDYPGYELEPPQPPPRRKSTTAIESTPATSILTISEQQTLPKEVTPLPTLVEQPQSGLPSRVGDLEVERLRVHALQAGQIMVSQLHGSQISADELQCKSGNLVVNNLEFPPGLIENIVERVRSTERSQLLTSETQTSREMLPDEPYVTSRDFQLETQIPPPKPPRLRANEAISSAHKPTEAALNQLRNYDEQTQTDPTDPPPLPPVYTSVEYLQSLAPLAFYNMRQAEMERYATDPAAAPKEHHHHHLHRRRRSCSLSDTDAEDYKERESHSTSRRSRTRSASHAQHSEAPPSVAQASRQFLSACSLSLVNIINQLTAMVRGEVDDQRQRHIPALVVLFIVITFGVLLYLLSGKSVHTHHWDYFNPPDNTGRKSS